MTVPVRRTARRSRFRFPALGRARASFARLIAGLRQPSSPRLRTLLAVAALVALVVAIVYSLFRLGAGVDLRAMEQARSDSSTKDLPAAASSIAQSFRSPRDNLSSVNVLLNAFVNPPDAGRVRLLRGDGLDGQPVYEAPLDTVSWDDNPYITVSFPPISNSEGVTYTLVLESPGKPLTDTLGSLVYNSYDALSSGTMYVDGKPQRGDVAIEVYYHYGMASL